MASSDGIFLQDLSDEDREKWIKKAPVPVRNYIAYLEGEIYDLDEMLQAEKKAVSFDEALSEMWEYLGCRRVLSGDDPGSDRAFRASRLVRVS